MGVFKAFLFLAVLPLFSLSGLQARADDPAQRTASPGNMIEIIPARAGAGPQFSWGQCPCFRWTVQVQALGGGIETRHFIISAQELFNFREETNPDFLRWQSRLYTIGAVEALWKGGHLGMGFRGLTFGEDRDRGYGEILRTGIYAIINVLLKDAVRLDIRSAYDFEQMRVNYGPELVRRGTFDESAVLNWHGGAWSGRVQAHVGFDDGRYLEPGNPRLGADGAVRARLVTFKDMELGLAPSASIDYDPFRELMGLEPLNAVVGLTMDLSYIVGGKDGSRVLR